MSVAGHPSDAQRFDNDVDGLLALAAALAVLDVGLVVMEAMEVTRRLWRAHCSVGLQWRWSIRAMHATLPEAWGVWPRPMPDARMLAKLAAVLMPAMTMPLSSPLDERQQWLAALVTRGAGC